VGALAHTLEAAGLATVGISLVRRHAELARPPRMLHCDFPLGRPLGRPGDARFQRAVLEMAFGLVGRTDVPVLVDHPEAIHDEATSPLACTLPPSHDPNLPPSLDEALALRPAHARGSGFAGATRGLQGPSLDVERLTALVGLVDRLADGLAWQDAGLTELELHDAAMALRRYYEQAALGLAGHVPAARQAESWFFQQTVVGNRLRQAQQRLRQAGAPRGAWFGLVPSTQPRLT
jgi:D-proline reductase (dithiol) PrdB